MKKEFWQNRYEELMNAIKQGADIAFCDKCDEWYDYDEGRHCRCCSVCVGDWDGDMDGNICRSCLEEMTAAPATMSAWERNA